MMTLHTKRCLDTAVAELKRNGYSVLMLMFDTKSDESRPLGCAIEVLSSETDDPQILADMARNALAELTAPMNLPRIVN